jgi:hypothetical protein
MAPSVTSEPLTGAGAVVDSVSTISNWIGSTAERPDVFTAVTVTT